jgi:hypothetical protein
VHLARACHLQNFLVTHFRLLKYCLGCTHTDRDNSKTSIFDGKLSVTRRGEGGYEIHPARASYLQDLSRHPNFKLLR